MAEGIFVHRADSKYDDFPEEQYQFAKRNLSPARHFVDDLEISVSRLANDPDRIYRLLNKPKRALLPAIGGQ